MAALIYLFSLATILPSTTTAYYLSYNQLTWQNAESFCQLQCQSHLASIHGKLAFDNIQTILANNSLIDPLTHKLWIGAYKDELASTFQWTDNSSFDDGFGSNLAGGVYPWSSNQPDLVSSNLNHVQLIYDAVQSEYVWNNVDGTSQRNLFLCNDCAWNSLPKHIYVDSQLTWSAAETHCRSNYGTSLTSIHSAADNQEAVLLSQLGATSSTRVYIGLHDQQNEGLYRYPDGTAFDYEPASGNLSGNAANTDCVYIDGSTNGGLWTPTDCSSSDSFFVRSTKRIV